MTVEKASRADQIRQVVDRFDDDLFVGCYHCLMTRDPFVKAGAVQQLYIQLPQLMQTTAGVAGAGMDAEPGDEAEGRIQISASGGGPSTTHTIRPEKIEAPGIPDKPDLVDPRSVKRRGFGSQAGRQALLHALAHIEFNAINLALDAAYRFRDMPTQYISDWLLVASDESRHFEMVAERLDQLGTWYGAYDAHAGLWNMALKTDHDVMVRMALVPRVLEARGLDVAPPMIQKFRKHDDPQSADILEVIFNDEIRHVQIGNHWFRYCCEQRGLTPSAVFEDLLRQHSRGYLRGPYNEVARVQAGFSLEELDALKTIEAEWQD